MNEFTIETITFQKIYHYLLNYRSSAYQRFVNSYFVNEKVLPLGTAVKTLSYKSFAWGTWALSGKRGMDTHHLLQTWKVAQHSDLAIGGGSGTEDVHGPILSVSQGFRAFLTTSTPTATTTQTNIWHYCLQEPPSGLLVFIPDAWLWIIKNDSMTEECCFLLECWKCIRKIYPWAVFYYYKKIY